MKTFPVRGITGVVAALLTLVAGDFLVAAPASLVQLAFPGISTGGMQRHDYTPIDLSYARTRGNPNQIEVVFTAPVAPDSVTNTANYTITPTVAVLAAVPGGDGYTVWLTTAAIGDSGNHKLTVNNVTDTLAPPNVVPTNATAAILKAQGVITRKTFNGIGGSALSDLTNNVKFPDQPDGVDWLTAAETPRGVGDNYGTQVAGFLHPPATGDYLFYVASDDQALLYLSPDENPASKVTIASVPAAVTYRNWTAYASQGSSDYVHLEAGHRYYCEVLQKEGGGDDFVSVTWRMRGMSAPATGDAPIPGAFLSSLTPSAPAGTLTPPQSQTVPERQSATFTVVPEGTPPYAYQWLRGGLPIPGATAASYTLTGAALSDHNAQFSVVVSNSFSNSTSAAANLTVLADTNPPVLCRLSGGPTLDKVLLTFSEPVTPSTANDEANYNLSGGLGVLDARRLPDQTNVVLTTTPQTEGATCSLAITGVTDTAAAHNSSATSSNFTAWVFSRGFARREVFQGISGSSIPELTAVSDFPDNPDVADYRPQAEAPQNVGSTCGERLLGWLLPPTNGFYLFYVYSADQGALYLSTDETPANKRLIAMEPQWNSYRNWVGVERRNATAPENRSLPIYLNAGQRYYFEAWMKDHDGDNRLGVTWQLPGAPPPVNGDPPIGAAYLACYASPVGVSLSIAQQPMSVTIAESAAANFTIGVASSYSPLFFQWQRNGIDIPGANSASYTTPRLLRTETGARYRCVVAIPGFQTNSVEATVTTTPDDTAPLALSAATLAGSTNLGLCFNELMDPASVTNPANYVLSNGGQVTGVNLRLDGQSVSLGVSLLSFTNYALTLNNLKDYAGNPLAPATTVPVAVNLLENTDIGIAGDPAEIGSTFSCSSNNFDVIAGGSDIWNNRDGFHYVYQTREGDFDARVRIARLDMKSTYTFAGLVARENLSPGSRNLRVHLFTTNGANGYHASTRVTQDGTTTGPSVTAGPVPYPNAWLRLTRTNDTFVGWRGTNGVDWTSYFTTTMSFTGRVHVGLAACPVNNSAGQATTAWFRDWSISPDYPLPGPLDLGIQLGTVSGSWFFLEDQYQAFPAGGQILTESANTTNPASFRVKVENDGGTNQALVVRATESAEPGWTVTYLSGSNDVTSLIRGATGYAISNLLAGSNQVLYVEMLPGSRVVGGTSKSVSLKVSTDTYTRSLRDAVQATAVTESGYQPDLQARRMTDVEYVGGGVYNLTGSNQTKQYKLIGAGTASYALKLVNAGNLTNTFQVTGTAGTSGWVVRYFDALTGINDVSTTLAGGGLFLTLIPGGSYDFRAEVRADAGVPPGSTNTLFVTARSVENAARADVVRMLTVSRALSNSPQTAVYTLDSDFEQGTLVGTRYGGNELTLADQSVTQPFIWVPNSNEGTVSKINIFSGAELARYRVAPQGVTAEPSRTTIDQYGNCYVANRQCATVVKIGLLENGEFIDRNGNGIPDTSMDTNYDGNITGGELLPFGKDECVLYEVVVIPGKEGTFAPGTYTNGYANDYWNPGPRSMAVDFAGNLWAGCWGTMKFYYVEGPTGRILSTNDVSSVDHHPYGALVDSHGILWSSGYHETVSRNTVLRFDPATGGYSNIIAGRRVYGLAIDRNDHLFITGGDSHLLTRYNVLTNGIEWTVNDPAGWTKGAATGVDGDVWVANESDDTATRFSNDGVLKKVFPIGDGPTGPALDAAGKIWVLDRYEETIRRIDPATDTIDLTKRIVGGTHYGYSDMTGVIARNTTARFGTWTALHDGGVEFAQWGKLTWNASDPSGTGVRIRVRSSNDGQRWSGWERATNGLPLVTTPPGQYLQIEVALTCRVHDPAPVLYDLTVEPLPQRNVDLAIALSATPSPATNEHLVTWSAILTNHGPAVARGTFVTHTLPAGITVLSATNSFGSLWLSTGFVRCDLGEFPPGAVFTLTVVAQVNTVGTLTNMAAVSHYETDPATANNQIVMLTPALALPCTTPPAGILSWWPAEGNANDATGTNNGSYVGAMSNALGRVGLAFSFNPAGAYVTIPASPSLNLGTNSGLTLETWIKPSDVAGAHPLFEWGRVNNAFGLHFWISVNLLGGGAGSLYANLVDTAGTAHNFSSTPGWVAPNAWMHVALTYDQASGIAKMYCNGTNVATATLGTFTPQTTSPLYLGYRLYDGTRFAGLMDEPAIYDRALSETEVQAIYEAGGSGKCGGSPGPPPSLTIGAGDAGLYQIIWPVVPSGFNLESSGSALGPWTNFGPPLLQGDHWLMPVNPTNPVQFFRLRQ